MATIKITSPQAKGHAKITVKGRPKLVFVNGHWNRVMNFLGMGPGKDSEWYWKYFCGDNEGFRDYLEAAKSYFGDTNYQERPYYVDGSSLYGGDMSGQDRKDAGYAFANEHLVEITKGVGNEKFYFVSHSEGCAYAAGMAKALIEKGYKVGESVMLSADEGDEFSVEGNYPCYQITAGRISIELCKRRRCRVGYVPPSRKDAGSRSLLKRVFRIDPVVNDHRIRGITRYGVYLDKTATLSTTHASTIGIVVFAYIKHLKTIKVVPIKTKNKVEYAIVGKNAIWHKIDDKFVINNNIDAYVDGQNLIIKE